MAFVTPTVLAVLATMFATNTGVSALQPQQLAFQYTRTSGFARMDPIKTPGQVGQHVHRFVGASYVLNDATYDTLQMSNCSTLEIQADKSAYWMPALYHIGSDKKYTLVEGGTNIVYYGTNGNPKPFPKDFKLVTGKPTQTCEEGPNRYYVCEKNGQAEHIAKLSDIGECDSLGAHIIFPSCWDGKAFVDATQDEHMVFPTEGSLGDTCPKSHPIKLPYVMMDMFGDTKGLPKNPNGPTWSLSTGDTEGCGLHADFMFGWDQAVFADALTECKDFSGDDRVNTCGPLKKYADLYTQATCQWQGPIPNENVGVGGAKLDAIPSCGNGVGGNLATCPSGPDLVNPILIESTQSSGGYKGTLPLPVIPSLKSSSKSILGTALQSGGVAKLASQAIKDATKPYANAAPSSGTTTHSKPSSSPKSSTTKPKKNGHSKKSHPKKSHPKKSHPKKTHPKKGHSSKKTHHHNNHHKAHGH